MARLPAGWGGPRRKPSSGHAHLASAPEPADPAPGRLTPPPLQAQGPMLLPSRILQESLELSDGVGGAALELLETMKVGGNEGTVERGLEWSPGRSPASRSLYTCVQTHTFTQATERPAMRMPNLSAPACLSLSPNRTPGISY